MSKQDEYQALGEEIMNLQQEIRNCRNLLYTVVPAILVFAANVDKDRAILYLIPFVVILPIFLSEMHQIDAMLRIGTYIHVFMEPNTECQWETRLYTYGRMHKNEYSTKKTSVDAYVLIRICCIVLSLMELDFNTSNLNFYLTIILQIIISLICIWVFNNNRFDYSKRKEKYINDWENIKVLEKKQKKEEIKYEK